MAEQAQVRIGAIGASDVLCEDEALVVEVKAFLFVLIRPEHLVLQAVLPEIVLDFLHAVLIFLYSTVHDVQFLPIRQYVVCRRLWIA